MVTKRSKDKAIPGVSFKKNKIKSVQTSEHKKALPPTGTEQNSLLSLLGLGTILSSLSVGRWICIKKKE